MTFSAASIVKELIAAGVTGDALVMAMERIEAASIKPRSAAAVRQARYRERVKEQTEGVTRDERDVTRDAKEKVSHTLPKENIYISTTTAREADETSEAIAEWNGLASELCLPVVQKLTPQRKSKLKARLSDCGGLPGWRAAMAKIRGSPFLRGDNRDGWKADFDFVLQQSSFVKLMEGKYDDSRSSKPKTAGDELAQAMAARRERALQGGEVSGERV